METTSNDQEPRTKDDTSERGPSQRAFHFPFAWEGLEQLRDPNC